MNLNFLKKNKIILFFLLILILFSYIIYQNIFQEIISVKKNNIKVNKSEKIEKINLKNIDSDGDGLKDWEEDLYGTNKNNIDSDGDGVSDFQEIKNKKNPLVFGDGKNENIEIIKSYNKNILSFENQIEELKKKKNKKGDKKMELKILSLENERKALKLKIEEYYAKNEKEKNKEKIYFNKIAEIVSQSEKIFVDSQKFDLLFDFNENNNLAPEDETYFKNFAFDYEKISDNLKKIKIQDIKIKNFKDRLSDIYKIISSDLKGLIVAKKEKNKEKGKEEIQKYLKDIQEMNLIFNDISDYLIKNNINFQSGEAGLYLRYN